MVTIDMTINKRDKLNNLSNKKTKTKTNRKIVCEI